MLVNLSVMNAVNHTIRRVLPGNLMLDVVNTGSVTGTRTAMRGFVIFCLRDLFPFPWLYDTTDVMTSRNSLLITCANDAIMPLRHVYLRL